MLSLFTGYAPFVSKMKKPKIASINTVNNPILGNARQVILSSEETDGDIYLVKGIMPQGSSVPVHIHQHEDEVFHVLEGEVELVLGEKTLVGRAGDVIYLPRGVKHGIKTLGEHTATVLNYVIPGANFEKLFHEMNALNIKPNSEDAAKTAKKYGVTFV